MSATTALGRITVVADGCADLPDDVLFLQLRRCEAAAKEVFDAHRQVNGTEIAGYLLALELRAQQNPGFLATLKTAGHAPAYLPGLAPFNEDDDGADRP
jgi:hypothetical protein